MLSYALSVGPLMALRQFHPPLLLLPESLDSQEFQDSQLSEASCQESLLQAPQLFQEMLLQDLQLFQELLLHQLLRDSKFSQRL